MHLIRQKGVQRQALRVRETGTDLGDHRRVGRMHRRGGHAFNHADAGNDDPLGAHPLDQPVEQNTAVSQTHRFARCPGGELATDRPNEVSEAMALADRGQLLVSGGAAPGKEGDGITVGADLFGDMIQHHARQQFAAAKISAGIAQATELKRVAEPGLGCPACGDRREIVCGEAVMPHDVVFRVRQRQQRLSLRLRHRYPRRHPSSLHKPLALRCHNERGL